MQGYWSRAGSTTGAPAPAAMGGDGTVRHGDPPGTRPAMSDTAILDVDGTLVDSNYQHALAWYRAFRRFGTTLPIWHLHRAVGMGGDQLVTHVAGERAESDFGDDVRAAHGEEFEALIGEVAAFPDAEALLGGLREDGLRIVLATSGSSGTAEHLLGLVDGRRHADAVVTSDDVEASKPAPTWSSSPSRRSGPRTRCSSATRCGTVRPACAPACRSWRCAPAGSPTTS